MKASATKVKVGLRQHLEKLIDPNSNGVQSGSVSEWRSDQIKKFLNDEEKWKTSESRPAYLKSLSNLDIYSRGDALSGDAFLYQDCVYKVSSNFTEEERILLVYEAADGERRFFEKLRGKFSSDEAMEGSKKRQHIPEAVRIAVWRRDQGRCVECGCRESLEYDHIIPVDKGGASTVRNVQLLCTVCNKKKGNRIDEVAEFRLGG